jgi:four helix bundle protein
MDLVVELYQVSKILPKQEHFGLVSQMCRAGVSVPANIAEGYGRKHRKEYMRFLSIAKGSLQEARTHLEICTRLGYVSREHTRRSQQLAEEVSKMLTGLIRSLNPEP